MYRAALYIEDGLCARSAHRLGTRNLRMHRWYYSNSWQRVVLGLCVVHMGVAFFEHPLHIAPSRVPRVGVLNGLVLDHPWLATVLLAVEGLCVVVYLFDAYLFSGFRPTRGRDGSGAWASVDGQKARDLWVLARVAISGVMFLGQPLPVSYTLVYGVAYREARVCVDTPPCKTHTGYTWRILQGEWRFWTCF